ncbi:MAG: hypothetical protein IPK13_04945 [Deltaproteobacteria bacterium]|nr:hypothetical protein [Deltaproteobacteria bacterium]
MSRVTAKEHGGVGQSDPVSTERGSRDTCSLTQHAMHPVRQTSPCAASEATRLHERLRVLSPEHQRTILRFEQRLRAFETNDQLSAGQCVVVLEHLVRLGERGRNPANTGNIEDLFCHTLVDTGDPIRAFAQALADSVKVVPMDEDAPLLPVMRSLKDGRSYRFVRDFKTMSPGDKMLVTHTMVAYGDEEMWMSARAFVQATWPEAGATFIDREVAKMAVQSQHLPSSTFVLSRAHGLTLECAPLYRRAGYDEDAIARAQAFYDTCAEFAPEWASAFVRGNVPTDAAWNRWRRRYLKARDGLPEELIYQLSSDTLTNFLEGTLESGKWTDATVFFGGVTRPSQIPEALAAIVNQYIAEHVALHDRPADELITACQVTLEPWGIGFVHGRAQLIDRSPPKADELEAQFKAAWARKKLGER